MNPSTGSFISMDTYEGSIYDPDTLYKYLYANGNPVTYSDPSGNFASAVGGLVATTINTVMNNFQTLNAMGIISGLTNSAITAFLGGSDMEIGEAFFKGYVTGFGLGAVLYVAAAYDVIVFAKMYLMISASNVSMSIVMTIASVIEKKERETLVYGTLAILSLFTLADAYNFNCMVNVIGDKGSASIGWEYNNPEEVQIEGGKTSGYNVSDSRRIHILEGEGTTDPGHGPNRGFTEGAFPDTWTDEQVISAIEDVANNPNSTWKQSTGSGAGNAPITIGAPDVNAPTMTNKGTPVRFVVKGRNHGLNITVIVEPNGEGIITGYNNGK